MLGNPGGNKRIQKYLQAQIIRRCRQFKSITADSIILENASLTLVDKKTKKIRGKLEGLDIRLSGIEIDSLKQYDSTQILFSKDLSMHVNQVELPFTKGDYNLQITNMDFDSRKGLFSTGQIILKTGMSETEFAAPTLSPLIGSICG
jgi:hypothetical protein